MSLICAGSCEYRGGCEGDDVLALIFDCDEDDNSFETCMEQSVCSAPAHAMGGNVKDPDGNEVDPEIAAIFSITKEICFGKSDDGARKLTAAPWMAAPKAMLSSIKTTALRLAQVRRERTNHCTVPPLPYSVHPHTNTRPRRPSHTYFDLPCTYLRYCSP